VTAQILEHQGQRPRRVLQIVNEKRRHRLERLELLRFGDSSRQAAIQNVAAQLVANAFQQVAVLNRKRDSRHTIPQP
jgi:hypothetical protein